MKMQFEDKCPRCAYRDGKGEIVLHAIMQPCHVCCGTGRVVTEEGKRLLEFLAKYRDRFIHG